MKRIKNGDRLYYKLMPEGMKRSPGFVIMTKPDPMDFLLRAFLDDNA
jgi:hypothetical protein